MGESLREYPCAKILTRPGLKALNHDDVYNILCGASPSVKSKVSVRDGTGQHLQPGPELTRNGRPVYAKPQLIFWPVARNIT